MTILDDLLAGNQTYQGTYAKYAEKIAVKSHPLKKIAIITCMDARLNPTRIFHLKIGDMIILRNAGNRVTEDVLRSLLVAFVKGVTEIIIMGHTDCGMTQLSRETMRAALQKLGGALDPITLLNFNDRLGTFSNEELNVTEQVMLLRSSSIIPPSIPLHGLLYHVNDGSLKVVINGYESLHATNLKTKSLSLNLNMPSLNMPSISGSANYLQLLKGESKNPSK